MANFCSGILKATGIKSNLIHFATDACHAVVPEDGNTITFNGEQYVTGTHGGFAYSAEPILFGQTEPTFIIEDLYMISIPYSQKWDIRAEDLKSLSRIYDIDFSISAYEPGCNFNRYVRIISGRILFNTYRKRNISFADVADQRTKLQQPGFSKTDEWSDYPSFTQDIYSAERTGDNREMAAKLQDIIIKSVSEEQKKRYISKCPCCGHDNMYSEDGKTFGFLSCKADIYICANCHVDEHSEQLHNKLLEEHPEILELEMRRAKNIMDLPPLPPGWTVYRPTLPPPLSEWAVFNPESLDAFLTDERSVNDDLYCVRSI